MSNSALDFLKKILPSEGGYCSACIKTGSKFPWHAWYDNIEALEKGIELIDAQPNTEAVYHATSSYGILKNKKGKRTRSQENVHSLRALYAEIDVREEKGYPTKEDAAEALASFLETTSLPIPMVVDSGGGYHLYWPLTSDIKRDAWEKYARGLKILCAKLGFKIDAPITEDSARILRTPGTTNRKYDNTIVRLVHDAGPYDLSAFTILLLQEPKPVKKQYERTPADATLVANKCAQLRTLRDNPDAQSGVAWIATGRLLAQCVDGEKFFEKWSSRDSRYNPDEAAKKWEESLAFNNATTCSYFETINPNGCEGCPFKGKIKSPIVLGRPQKSKLPEDVAVVLEAQELPKGFSFDANGKLIHTSEKKGEGEEAEEKVTIVHDFPIIVSDRHISETTGEDYRIALRHWQPHDGWTDVHVDASELLRNTESAFGGKGVFSADDRLLKRYVKQMMSMLANTRAASMSYETFGWKSDKTQFLWGNRLYGVKDGNIEIQDVVLSGTAKTLADHLRPGGKAKSGSLNNWRAAAQQLFAPGHEWQACTLLGGFAAIIMALTMPAEGGLVWSTYEAEGAKGKSLATMAACSIWGDPSKLSTTASDTAKGRLAILGTLRHLPLGFDEMKRTDAKLVKDFLQQFTMGSQGNASRQDRQLMTSVGNWCTLMLTSSNQELVGVIEGGDGSKAMKSRIFEVHASDLPLDKREYKESFKNGFLNNCGHAGETFLKYVVFLQNNGGLKQLLDAAEEMLTTGYNFGPEQRFKLGYFKAIYVTAQILTETEMLAFSPDTIIEWLIERSGHVNLGQWVGTEREDMADVLSEYLRSSIRNTLVVDKPFVAGHGAYCRVDVRPTAELTIRRERSGNMIMLDKKALRDWLREKKDISLKHFLEALEGRKIIRDNNAKKSLGAGTEFGVGRSSVIIVNGNHPEVIDVTEDDNVIDLEEAKASRR